MSFPNIHYGSFGDEKVTSTSRIGGLPIGTRMELPDGRAFRLARAGSAAVIPGNLYYGPAVAANTIFSGDGAISLVPNAAPVGASTMTVTGAGTVLAKGVFDGGYLCIASSVGTGIGYTYKIDTQDGAASASATGTITIALEQGDEIAVALQSGTTRVRLAKNPFNLVDIAAADTTGYNTVAGVACASAAASCYVWLQRRGPATVLQDGVATVIGCAVVASSTVAGAVGAPPAGSAAVVTLKQALPIGYCMCPSGTSTQFAVVDLTIE